MCVSRNDKEKGAGAASRVAQINLAASVGIQKSALAMQLDDADF
jgi:hypothetical protein